MTVSHKQSERLKKAGGSCFECRYIRWDQTSYASDAEEGFCKRHDRRIDDMFDGELNMSEVGCLQFKPLTPRGGQTL